jgi:hypothetical protein
MKRKSITDKWYNSPVKILEDVYPLRKGREYVISKPPAGETNNFLHVWIKKNDKFVKVYHYQIVMIIK